ncbi:MAG: 3-oxoacyl-[acyl-carrier-protein] reductase [Saprospiraceae bacterium]|nr:3-oxoacyl-[acyl-carrier-protein] reductase [Saprospiraceae bacterium]
MSSLKDQVCLVTGGSRGIGAGIVSHFVKAGAHVYFTYRSSAEKADSLIKSLDHAAGNVNAFQSDASDFDQAEQAVKSVIEQAGKIDVLINNAGITDDALMLRMSEEQWDRVITANLKSVFNLTKHVLRPMLKARAGSIINVSSVVGVFGNAGQANYAASKAGILGFTKSIAKEVGSRSIRCNAIVPGYIETEMTGSLDEKVKETFLQNIPLKRMGHAEEIAQLAAFLASPESSYITGQVISICGGLNM